MKQSLWAVISKPGRRTPLAFNIVGFLSVLVGSCLSLTDYGGSWLPLVGLILWLIGEGGLLRSLVDGQE